MLMLSGNLIFLCGTLKMKNKHIIIAIIINIMTVITTLKAQMRPRSGYSLPD